MLYLVAMLLMQVRTDLTWFRMTDPKRIIRVHEEDQVPYLIRS